MNNIRIRTCHVACTYTFMRAVALLLIIALVWPAPTAHADQNTQDFADFAATDSDRLLVGVEPGLSHEAVADELAAAGLRLEHYWPQLAIAEASALLEAEATASSLHALAQSAYAAETFRYISPNQRVTAADELITLPEPPLREPQPNDPLFAQQWAPERVRAVDAWNISRGSPNVVVAVIDSGYEAAHPDIDAATIWRNQVEVDGAPGVDDDANGYIDDFTGWDWVDYDNSPDDPYGHGTHVMGVVAAATGNEVGVAGLGRQVRVAPLRMLDAFGNGYVVDLLNAVDYGIQQGMDVFNLSLTITSDNPAIRDAMAAASAAGITIVAATGNYNTQVFWPAAYPETVAIAATDSEDRRATFSNFGSAVDVAAPGTEIMSLYRGGSYRALSGTSMATPHAAALFALLRSLRPDLDAEQLLEIVKSSADDVNAGAYPGEDDLLGAGRINIYSALLNASAGLNLGVTPDTLPPHVLGDPLPLQLRVSTGDNQSIQGAVAYARVFAASDTAGAAEIVPVERAATNGYGAASFTITSPEQAGHYFVRIQAGAAYRDLPLQVIEPPTAIQLAVQSRDLDAGDDSTEYSVRLRDAEGRLLAGETPIHIETSAGELEGGATELNAVAQEGFYSGTLYAGTVAASGRLTVSVGDSTASSEINVLPGAPARIRMFTSQRLAGETETLYAFEVVVRDRFDNLVVDGTPVRPGTTAGALDPTQTLVTKDGCGCTPFYLRVPNRYTGPIVVSAEVAGYGLSTTLEVRTVQLWLPSAQK